MLYKHMILDDVGVTKKIWSDYILVTFWLHIMVYGYTESDVIAELRGWNEMSGDNDVVLYVCCGYVWWWALNRMYATSSLSYPRSPPL